MGTRQRTAYLSESGLSMGITTTCIRGNKYWVRKAVADYIRELEQEVTNCKLCMKEQLHAGDELAGHLNGIKLTSTSAERAEVLSSSLDNWSERRHGYLKGISIPYDSKR